MSEQSVFEGLLVVELASVLAGPAVGMFFAELGSRVIKVENPETAGDVTRSWRGPTEDPGLPAAYYSSINWGKQSIAVDLRTGDGRAVVHDLVRHADVVVVSYKAGDAARFGVDFGTLSSMNARLIYAEVTAYGGDDPRVGYDAVIQAETGFTSMNGTEESGPLKMPVALMDLLAGHQLKEGILAALLERERSGRGRRVSVSLFESGLAALANQAANWLMTGVVPERLGSAHPNIVPYGTSYRCRDGGFVVLAVGSDSQFSRLASCLGDRELAADPRFATKALRVRNRTELEYRLSALVGEWERRPLSDRLRTEGVPSGAVRDVREALLDPLAAPLLLSDESGASAVRTRVFGDGIEQPADLARPPSLSEHTHTVLSDLLGYTDDRIEGLVQGGSVTMADRGGAA
ncbi:MAG: CoA transferase [Gemmatimonadetes bacterium]|nr:CoA transferase [Gemmatimonadota bacterium]